MSEVSPREVAVGGVTSGGCHRRCHLGRLPLEVSPREAAVEGVTSDGCCRRCHLGRSLHHKLLQNIAFPTLQTQKIRAFGPISGMKAGCCCKLIGINDHAFRIHHSTSALCDRDGCFYLYDVGTWVGKYLKVDTFQV